MVDVEDLDIKSRLKSRIICLLLQVSIWRKHTNAEKEINIGDKNAQINIYYLYINLFERSYRYLDTLESALFAISSHAEVSERRFTMA